MEYNTSLKKLVLPEYGRNIQKMVNHVKSIEDSEERNKGIRAIITIMGNMNPHLRDINDFKHKLWDHIAIMADFDMNIDTPYPTPTKESLSEKPNPIPYNTNEINFRYHGRIIEQLIEKTITYEDGDEKDTLIKIIANHMKKSYLMWNQETVSDEIIFRSLNHISKGKLNINNNLVLTDSREILAKSKRKRTGKRDNGDRTGKRDNGDRRSH